MDKQNRARLRGHGGHLSSLTLTTADGLVIELGQLEGAGLGGMDPVAPGATGCS